MEALDAVKVLKPPLPPLILLTVVLPIYAVPDTVRSVVEASPRVVWPDTVRADVEALPRVV